MRWHPSTCRICNRSATAKNPISARGKCRECGIARATKAATEMHAHKGQTFDRWAEGMQEAADRAVELARRRRRKAS